MSEVMNSAQADDARPTLMLAIGFAAAVLVILGILHILSPEFDPSWRMVSEYAHGRHGFVLSAMFMSWALSSWTLAYGLRPQLATRMGKIGFAFLVLAGVGQTMGAVFDIDHALHGPAAIIGIPSLAIAAMLISLSLAKQPEWQAARKPLLWAANLTWISIALMALAFAIFIPSFKAAGGDMSGATHYAELPAGTIAYVGWANRFLFLTHCAFTITAAWQALKLARR